MELRSTVSTKLAVAVLLAVFAVQVYRAITVPIGLSEAYLYDRFVRPTVRQALASELPDRDVLYGLLEKRSVGLFHVSPFSVRLPSLLFCILYLISIYRFASVLLKRWFWLVLSIAGVGVLLRWDYFARADGRGAALALLACAVWLTVSRRHLNWAGICIGLSIAARTGFSIPAVLVALAILASLRSWEWVEKVAIPAAVVAVILLAVPLSHATAPEQRLPEWTDSQAANLHLALEALERDAGSTPARIVTVPGGEPVANFYRAQHRLRNWGRAEDFTPAAPEASYYVLLTSATGWVDANHVTVIYRNADFQVAHAAM